MPWSKIDDRLHSHPKVQHAWQAHRASLGLHLLALSHVACHLTNGHVSHAFVRTHLPDSAERRRATSVLVDAGLWHRSKRGFLIHDYLDHNPSDDEVAERRAARSEAGRRGGIASGKARTDAKQNRLQRTNGTRSKPSFASKQTEFFEAKAKQMLAAQSPAKRRQMVEQTLKQTSENERNANPVPVPVPLKSPPCTD